MYQKAEVSKIAKYRILKIPASKYESCRFFFKPINKK